MPGEVIDRANPQPLPSNVDESVLSLAVKLDKTKLEDAEYAGLQNFRRAANYIAACETEWLQRRDNKLIQHTSYDLSAGQYPVGAGSDFQRYQTSITRLVLHRPHYVEMLTSVVRPLGNMSRLDARILPPQPACLEAKAGHHLHRRLRPWRAGYPCKSVARRVAGEILSAVRQDGGRATD